MDINPGAKSPPRVFGPYATPQLDYCAIIVAVVVVVVVAVATTSTTTIILANTNDAFGS